MHKFTKIIAFLSFALVCAFGAVAALLTYGTIDGHTVYNLLIGLLIVLFLIGAFLADTNSRVISRLIKENDKKGVEIGNLIATQNRILSGKFDSDIEGAQKNYVECEQQIKILRSEIKSNIMQIEKRSSIQRFL